jgi:hypothetical protein
MGASERAIRFSPLDATNYIPQDVIGFGNFLLDRREGAVAAGRRSVQLNPGFSILFGCSRRHSRSSDGSTKQKSLARGYWRLIPGSPSAAGLPRSALRLR